MTSKQGNEWAGNRSQLDSIILCGLNHRHPRAYGSMLASIREDRDNLLYMRRILGEPPE